MKDIAIITDSTCDLNKEIIEKYDIQMIPLQIIYNTATYRDRIDMDYQRIYEHLDEEIPKTSLPQAQDIVDVFEKLKKNGVKHVLCMFISANLSGTYNLISNIAQEYKESMEIEIIETKTISMGIGHSVIQAAKAIEEGKTFPEVVKTAKEALKNTRTFFVLSTLTYLIKGGRLGKVSGSIGNMLNLKPIIGVDEIDTGQYYTIKKVRGRNNSLKSLYEIAQKLLKGRKNCDVAIADAIAKDERDQIAQMLQGQNENISSFIKTSVTPVIAVHTGPGLVGISIHCKDGLDDLRDY